MARAPAARRDGLRVIALIGLLGLVTTPAAAQETPAARTPDGAYLYRTYCAVCHGESARGDGPLAASMRRRPPDLTAIRQRFKGAFPRDLMFRVIDGRQNVAGHGGPDMPVWGDAFMRAIDGGDEATVRQRIQALVEYLEAIQARNTE